MSARAPCLGADPFKIERLWRIVYSSGYTQRPDTSLMGILSGIEMACWDIVGKELSKPVYELLGGRVHERLRSYTYHLYPQDGDRTDVYQDPIWRPRGRASTSNRGSAVKFDPVGPFVLIRRSCRWRPRSRRALRARTLRDAVGNQPLRDLLFVPGPMAR